ncbi:TIGR02680 family protein [Streptomonospora wellingtoniae]|uniref:TIGR02680 family protein n=1 Tax=Streptomonospora wellingtoniae TaxID=3075544 RepID=A0ABU2KP30_9ACTN|nr:TIGR02680 family protein [Streptomonospora sp. DSM 45055]MDT0300971.1 TIGR02680 family protein [Streptomonospora sp. DSM 45055]
MSADAPGAADGGGPAERGGARPRERWRLHRAGVVNIWQYRDEEFDLSGGRVIFKGTNGSGKSRTLELLLPLCLDGDLRNMGCKGFDTVSMSRLMLDDYAEGSMRLGYAWTELRSIAPDGTEEFATCGVGVKASASSRQVSDSWRFITPLRVNKDFALTEQDRPISQARLRERIGEDAVLGGQEAFQQRVAATVYGISGGSRYSDLLHLQRTLRNPDIGLKVLQGQLEQLLSDALPPVDPDVISRTATGLDNLEGVRRNVARLRRADTALGEFLDGYGGYALGVLTDRTAKLEAAEADARRAEGRSAKRESERASAEEALRGAEAERDAVTERADAVQTELEALKASPAYTALGDLEDKEAAVASQRRHAAAALENAAGLRSAEEQSVGAVERAAGLVDRLGAAASAGAAEAREALEGVGLGAALGRLPALAPEAGRGRTVERVLLSPEPGARPEEVHRESAPGIAAGELRESAEAAAEGVDEAARAAAGRGPELSALRSRAEHLDEEGRRVDGLGEQAARAAEDADAAARSAREGEERLRESGRDWAEAVARWHAEALPVDDRPEPGELPEPPDGDEVGADPEGFRGVHRDVRTALAPRVRGAQHAVLQAEQRLAETRDERSRLEKELAELRASAEVEPPAPALSTAARTADRGAPFHRLVDFADGVPGPARARLEAALEAAGLLTAWVRADGRVDGRADGDDTLAVAGPECRGPSLADALRPAAGDAAVSDEAVEALLRSVPLLGTAEVAPADSAALASRAQDAPGGLAFGLDGRWRSGPLHGLHRKGAAEHIGAGAREEARRRRVAELEEHGARLSADEEALQAELAAAQRREAAWNTCLEAFPDIGEVLREHIETRSRRSAAARAAADAEEAEAGHARARARLAAEQADHRRGCAELSVAPGAAELRRLCEQARRAVESLEGVGALLRRDYAEALRSLAAAQEDHERTVESRRKAEGDAAEIHRAYTEAHAVLSTLRSGLGSDAEEVGGRIAALQEERGELRNRAPKAQGEVEAAIKALADAEGRLGAVEAQVREAGAKVADAEDALTDAAGVGGVWEAATGLVEPPFQRAELRAALSAAVAERAVDREDAAAERSGAGASRGKGRRGGGKGGAGDPAALERDLIARLQALQSALAGTHDVQADRDQGILTVTVSDEAGTAPVAATARATAARLAQAEDNLTAREESVFEEYLLGDIAEELHRQIGAAEALTRRMNTVLEAAHSSQGVRVELSWEPSPQLDPAERAAFALAKKPLARRSAEENDRLRRALMDRIRATRAQGAGTGYAELLSGALDYRRWYAYRVRIHDTGPDGRPRDRRVRQLSSGETRLVSYVTLFAASAAFYDALQSDAEGSLRMVLLDEAFERLDDPTIARLLELLVDLDMDWAITWPSGYGVSPRIDRMHIYDILKRKGAWGVACARTTWNGAGFERAG